jgi:hypothetical protein
LRNGIVTWHIAQKPEWVAELYETLLRV